jgi:hypothetical protein
MMTYGSEVSFCQYGIFCKIRNDTKAIERRKVARLGSRDIEKELSIAESARNTATLESFF